MIGLRFSFKNVIPLKGNSGWSTVLLKYFHGLLYLKNLSRLSKCLVSRVQGVEAFAPCGHLQQFNVWTNKQDFLQPAVGQFYAEFTTPQYQTLLQSNIMCVDLVRCPLWVVEKQNENRKRIIEDFFVVKRQPGLTWLLGNENAAELNFYPLIFLSFIFLWCCRMQREREIVEDFFVARKDNQWVDLIVGKWKCSRA